LLDDVMRVRNGKITEHWGIANLFSLMQQLGAWPASKDALEPSVGRRFRRRLSHSNFNHLLL
jgi:hypothetical protein